MWCYACVCCQQRGRDSYHQMLRGRHWDGIDHHRVANLSNRNCQNLSFQQAQLNFRWNPRYSAMRTYLTISYNLRIRKRVLFMCMGIDGLLGEENMKYWNTHFKNQSWGKPVLIEDFVEASKQVEHFLLILHEETATDGVLQHDSWRWNSATTRS